MAENKEIIEAVVQAKTQEKVEDLESKHEKVSENLTNIYAERLRQKANELDAIERDIDKKIVDFKDFINRTNLGGRGIVALEKTEKQRKDEETADEIKKFMTFRH